MRVSVIMPVYNAAGTVQSSLDSIRNQSFGDFELIMVDDCSTDSTYDILCSFAAGSGIACKIVRMPENSGVAAARNAGLKNAVGEYVAWVDADDNIGPDALKEAVSLAVESEADIVGWDWTLTSGGKGREMRQVDYDSSLEALKAMMGGTMRWNLWLFLTRRTLLVDNGIEFTDGADMGEDMAFMLKSFACARKVRQIHRPLYAYSAPGAGSVSREFTDKRIKEVARNVRDAEKFLSNTAYGKDLADYFQYLKLFVKLPLLISSDKRQYELWYGWFPESNSYASANKALPLRTRALQAMAAKRMWLGVKLYNCLVYKFLYGLIYR